MKSERLVSLMKKMFVLLIPGLGILLGACSFLSAKAVSGIGVYTMRPGMGQFLSVSRHYTAAGSAVLLLISLLLFVRALQKKRADCKESKSAEPISVPEMAAVSADSSAETVLMPAEENPESVKEPTAAMVYDVPKCEKCGAPLKEGARFCEKCGERVVQPVTDEQPEN